MDTLWVGEYIVSCTYLYVGNDEWRWEEHEQMADGASRRIATAEREIDLWENGAARFPNAPLFEKVCFHTVPRHFFGGNWFGPRI
jgi:hypothetical protein